MIDRNINNQKHELKMKKYLKKLIRRRKEEKMKNSMRSIVVNTFERIAIERNLMRSSARHKSRESDFQCSQEREVYPKIA